jgi:hypothetical protein
MLLQKPYSDLVLLYLKQQSIIFMSCQKSLPHNHLLGRMTSLIDHTSELL